MHIQQVIRLLINLHLIPNILLSMQCCRTISVTVGTQKVEHAERDPAQYLHSCIHLVGLGVERGVRSLGKMSCENDFLDGASGVKRVDAE